MNWPKPEKLNEIPSQGHVVLEASAGTGKTYTIEHMVADFVLQGVPLPEILVVTYTEKATLELKRRIRELLARMRQGASPIVSSHAHWSIEDVEKQRLEEALAAFDRASIFTMHGFCKRVLADEAFAGGRLLEQDMVDETSVVAKAFRTGLRESFLNEGLLGGLLAEYLKGGKKVMPLQEELGTVIKRGHRVRPYFEPSDFLKQLAEARTRFSSKKIQEAIAFFEDTALHAATKKAKRERLMGLDAALAQTQTPKDLLTWFAEGQAYKCADLLDRNDKKAKKPLAFLIPDHISEPLLSWLQSVVDWVRRLPQIKTALLQLMSEDLKKRTQVYKQEQGLMDYDDLLYEVGDALRQDPQGQLLVKLRKQYRVGIIDEFQDTNPVQWFIFHTLFGQGDDHRLFLVGDPKQAIYAFNGADIYTYVQAVDALKEAGAAEVPLLKNYRSTGPMIDFCNAFFQGAPRQPYFTGGFPEFVSADKGRPEASLSTGRGASAGPLRLMTLNQDDVPNKTLRSQVWGQWMAQEIKALLDPQGPGLQWEEDGELQKLRARDVFVLCRKGKEVKAAGKYLQEAGVPFAFFKDRGLFDTPEAKDVLHLFLALQSPADVNARLRAFLTPFFGAPLSALDALRDASSDHPWVKRMYYWAKLAHTKRFDALYAALLYESGLWERQVLLTQHQRVQVNVAHLLEVLLLEDGGAVGLTQILEQLQGLMSGSRRLPVEGGDETRVAPQEDAVQIMTMHKAKGLEAQVVFLFGGFSGFKEKSYGLLHDEAQQRVLSFVHEDKPLARAEAQQEDQRLLYVALTRAKGLLYLPYLEGYQKDELKGIQHALQPRLETLLAHKEVGVEQPLTPKPENHMVDHAAIHLEGWQPPEAGARPDMVHERTAARSITLSSYSSLKSMAEDQGRLGLTLEDEVAGVAPDAQGLPRGKAFGLLLHDLLEMMPLATLKQGKKASSWMKMQEVKNLFNKIFAQRGFSSEWVPQVGAMVHAALTQRLEGGGGPGVSVAMADKVFREVPFMFPYPEAQFPDLTWDPSFRVNRGYVHGFIDVIFESGGRIFSADWKSDALWAYDPKTMAGHVSKHYSLQQKLYTLALVKIYGLFTQADYDAQFGGFGFVFLRGFVSGGQTGWFFEKPSFSDVLAFEAELKAGALYEKAHPWP